MQKRWNILSTRNEKVESLSRALNINQALCRILVQRGIESFDQARSYFRPQLSDLHDPRLMKGMDAAVHRITEAVGKGEKILVFGDYDVDGTTSVAMVYQFLNQVYHQVDFYIPHRYREGYGVSRNGIDFAAENGFSLIISLDCGIKSTDLISYAKSLQIDFIVCDHHLPDKILPPAIAILNPKQEGCAYPYKELCGCGVGFKLMQALSQVYALPEASYLQYLDLVATAIAADIVPVTGENRVLAFFGLKKINENACVGLRALLHLAGVEKRIHLNTLVFVVAPRINAAGRMDDAKKAVQLFVEQDFQKALQLASLLHNDNTDRREADSSITAEALEMIKQNQAHPERKTTLVYREHWHKGVVGIVASRLIETYYRPTVVLTKSGDVLAGSARSVAGFNLYEAIYACREHLLGYGGHFAAAGLTLLPEKLEAFREKFEGVVASTIGEDSLIPEILVDAEITFRDITRSFYHILTQMEPFGPENLRPVFLARQLRDSGYSKIVKEQHIRFVVLQQELTFTGIGFGMAEKFPMLAYGKPVDLLFTIEENDWKGEKNLQLHVLDMMQSS